MSLKGLGVLLALLIIMGVAACGGNTATTDGGACGGCGSAEGDISDKYDNVAMVFFHSDT